MPPLSATLTGTTNEIIVSNGPGSITLSTPQPIAPTSSPSFQSLTLSGNLNGPINTRTADNIVSCSTSQTTDNLVSFSGSGISALSGPWLPLAGGTMSGNINMGTTHEINEIKAIRPPVSTNNIIGDTNTASTSTYCTLVGCSTVSDSQYVSSLGAACGAQNSPYSTSAGFLSYCVNSDSGIAIGNFSRCLDSPNGIAIGHSNVAGSTGSILLGSNCTSYISAIAALVAVAAPVAEPPPAKRKSTFSERASYRHHKIGNETFYEYMDRKNKKNGEGRKEPTLDEGGMYDDQIVMSHFKDYKGTIMRNEIKTLLPGIEPRSRCFYYQYRYK